MYIKIPYNDVQIMNNPLDNTNVIQVRTVEALDSIIQQCRDIKISIIEGEKSKS